MTEGATRRMIVDEERRLGVNLPGLLRERLLRSNGGMCTVDGEEWTLFAISAALSGEGASINGTVAGETESARAEYGDDLPNGLIQARRIVNPGYLLLTTKGRLAHWDPVTGDVALARVDWAPPVPEPRYRRKQVPSAIVAAVGEVLAADRDANVLAVPGLPPEVVVAGSTRGTIATTPGGQALPASALDSLGGSIDPQLIALGWRLQPDWGWVQEWPASAHAAAIARAIADTFDHAYGLRAEMIESRTPGPREEAR